MYNRRYDKVFLMLRQEMAGYGLGQRTPWGSCVMEIKNGGGRIHLTAQGLRPLRRGQYSVYAIGGVEQGTKAFYCGELLPDSSGHGEVKWDFTPDNLEGSTIKVEALHTVAVLAEEGRGLSVPLSASVGEKVAWRSYFRPTPTEKMEERPQSISVTKDEEIMLVAAEAAVLDAPAKPETEDVNYHGSFRGLLDKFRRELDELQEGGVFSQEERVRIEKGAQNQEEEAVEEAVEEQGKEEEEIQEEPETEEKTRTIVADLLSENASAYPFGQERGEWKVLSLEELILLDGIPLAWQKNPFFLLPARKFYHFIWKQDGDGFSIGVPGLNEPEVRELAEALGFFAFLPIEGEKEGYWLWKQKEKVATDAIQ